MTDQTAQEMKKANIAKMGDKLGSLYSGLWQDVAGTHVFWLEYVELFGTKKERTELLNRSAPYLFRMLQDELWEMTLLHLARVTDPAFSFGNPDKANLSIQGLAAHVTDAKTKAALEKAVAEAVTATSFARDWRNRLIAHRDLKLALEEPTEALADASRDQVNDALKSLTAVLNVLSKHHFNSENRFDLVPRHNGAVTLLYALNRSDKVQAARLKRLEEGKPLEDDDFDEDDV